MNPPDDPKQGLMRDLTNPRWINLTNPRWIKVKGALFLFLGLLAAGLLLIQRPSVVDALLLVICLWGFCRAYYFAFYVIEHYVDPGYRFSGLWSFFRYWRRKP